jgi:hypothetical protein
MTDDDDVRRSRLGELHALNLNLKKLDATPLVTDAAAAALGPEELREAIGVTGSYLVRLARGVAGG